MLMLLIQGFILGNLFQDCLKRRGVCVQRGAAGFFIRPGHLPQRARRRSNVLEVVSITSNALGNPSNNL